MKDSCYRRLLALQLLPVEPHKTSIKSIHSKLEAEGIEVSIRTLQRDLVMLSQLFPINTDGNKDIPGWYWNKGAERFDLPHMQPSAALSFHLAKKFLEKYFPDTTLQELQPYFKTANQVLDSQQDNTLSKWSNKVVQLSRAQALIPPAIDSEVISSIYLALLSEKQIKADYRPRGKETKEYMINPLGLVSVDEVTYLVGTLWNYSDIRQFALHRFESVECLSSDIVVNDEFDLDEYVKKGNFDFLIEGQEEIKIVLKISPFLEKHLSESKLASNQTITEKDGGFFLEATTANTKQLRWWIMGLGASVEVIEPRELRNDIKEKLNETLKQYL